MPNRTQRRLSEKRKKAIGKELSYLNKTEEKNLWFHEGFNSALRAAYASFVFVMNSEKMDQDLILKMLHAIDDKLMFYIGEEELIREAFDASGLFLDFTGTFSNERIQKKETKGETLP